MTARGKLTHRRKCRKLVRIKARGTRKWSLSLKHHMPRGRYRITVSGLDKKGNSERQRSGNTASVRVR